MLKTNHSFFFATVSCHSERAPRVVGFPDVHCSTYLEPLQGSVGYLSSTVLERKCNLLKAAE